MLLADFSVIISDFLMIFYEFHEGQEGFQKKSQLAPILKEMGVGLLMRNANRKITQLRILRRIIIQSMFKK